MKLLLADERIETRCAGCKETIPRSFGYLLSRKSDVCLCGQTTNLRAAPFLEVFANMEIARAMLAQSLRRLGSVGSGETS